MGRHTSKHLEQASSQLIDARHSRRLSTPTEFVSPNPHLFHAEMVEDLASPPSSRDGRDGGGSAAPSRAEGVVLGLS